MCSGYSQGPEQVVLASELRHLLDVDVIPIFELLFAQMAASCANMAVALKDAAEGKQVCLGVWDLQQRCTMAPSHALVWYELPIRARTLVQYNGVFGTETSAHEASTGAVLCYSGV